MVIFGVSEGRLRPSALIRWVRTPFLDASDSTLIILLSLVTPVGFSLKYLPYFMATTVSGSFTIQNAKVKQSRTIKVLEHYKTHLYLYEW